MDDYDAILRFIAEHKDLKEVEKFFHLFSQHNEHRIFSSHVCVLLYNQIFGGINFRHLVFLGNVQLIGILVAFVVLIKRAFGENWFFPSFITAVGFFDLNNWGIGQFALGSIQNYGIVFFFLFSLLAYCGNGHKLALGGAALQLLLTFSGGNGIVGSFFICLFNLFYRDKFKILLSVTVLVVFGPMYFLHFIQSGPPFVFNFDRSFTYFFRYISSQIVIGDPKIAVNAGISIFLTALVLIPVNRRGIIKEAFPFLCIFGFTVATIGLTSVVRSALGPEIPSRYLLYNHLFTTALCLFLLFKLRANKAFTPVSVTLVFVLGFFYSLNYPDGKRNVIGIFNHVTQTEFAYPIPEKAREISNKAKSLGIYDIGAHRKDKQPFQ